MSRRAVGTLALAALAVIGTTGNAPALFLDAGIRSISAELRDRNGVVIAEAGDSEIGSDNDPYTENLSVFIGGSGFQASVGMNQNGLFGIDASTITGSRMTTRISILETYTNDLSVPVDLATNFIVVDGFMSLVAGDGGTLSYDLAVGLFPFGDFNGQGVLTGSTAAGFSSTFTETGDSLGATQTAVGNPVSIPFSVHEIDLGRVGPGESIDYFYSLQIVMDALALEIAAWQFIDPGQTSPLPVLSQVTATPAAPAVPIPATLPLLASAIAAIACGARRRRRST